MEKKTLGNCWHCGTVLVKADYGRETACLKCAKATRVCRNCRWYRPGVANQCQEPMAEEVMDKQRANFCDYFEPAMHSAVGVSEAPDALRDAAEDLFK